MASALRWPRTEPLPLPEVTFDDRVGTPIVIRALQPKDAPLLDAFLAQGLSASSKQRFGAHPVELRGKSVCSSIGEDDTLRIVAISGDRIVGYLILNGVIPAKECDRYRSHAAEHYVGDRAVRLAPAVADDFHGHGVGKALIRYAVSAALKIGITHIVLWGGTHDDNAKGRALYERTGFVYIGTFESDRPDLKPDGPMLNHDMALEVATTVAADPTLPWFD